MSDERIQLTADQAIAMLPDGDEVHTFVNPWLGMLLGSDWPRKEIIDAINKTDHRELSGKHAASMGHGLVITHGDRWLFIATKEVLP